MSVSSVRRAGGYLERPAPSGLADVVEVILDKGLVVEAYVRVSLVGIEVLTADARVVVASVDTYLRFAEAASRLDVQKDGGTTLPDMAAKAAESAMENQGKRQGERLVPNAVKRLTRR
jgi:hypothetical protein